MVKTEHGVVVWPDPVLDAPCAAVETFDAALAQLLEEMERAMHAEDGIGIAANQIGVPLRVALVGRGDGTFFEIVNPEIVAREEPVELREGCLSVPGEREQTPRFRKVTVRYQDRTGAAHEIVAEDTLAHVLQHEIGHLNGQVYVALLSPLRRSLIRQRMGKVKKQFARRLK